MGWVHTVYNITAASAVDRDFVYIWGSQRSFCGSLWGALGALGVPFGVLGGLWGSLWAALECLIEMLREMEPLT